MRLIGKLLHPTSREFLNLAAPDKHRKLIPFIPLKRYRSLYYKHLLSNPFYGRFIRPGETHKVGLAGFAGFRNGLLIMSSNP